MMPAAKHFDIILGIDIHMVVTPPAPPLPMPHPFIGMVFDPTEFLPMLGATVWVNGVPRAQAGTGGSNKPSHFPMGAKFVMPSIANEGEVFMGSATVLVEDEPFSFLAVPVLSCNDVGMPTPFRANKKAKKSLFLPTSVILPIPLGQPVLVGGPPTISLTGMAFKAGLSALKGLGKLARKWQKNSKAWKKLSNKIHELANKAFKNQSDNFRNRVNRAICAVTGHPVDIATGKVFTEYTDFELPGPIPFKWERVWYSTSTYHSPIGYGWHHNYDLYVYEDVQMNKLILRTADGRNVVFPQLAVGDDGYNRQERLTLLRDEQGYFLRNAEGLIYRFQKQAKADAKLYRLSSITDPSGHQIHFNYTPEGHLQQMIDSAGRQLQVKCDVLGRMTAIHAPHPDKAGETFPIVRYSYDKFGNMVEVRDALDQPFRYEYDNHLLVKETNRNGLSFYFEYDGTDANARCIHTWGDGGIYNHKLTYFVEEGYTIVENSLGHQSYYYWNEDGLVYRKIDPLGNETSTKYDSACQVIQEVDELGYITSYTYDTQGNRTGITKPDGSTIQLQYDENNQLLAVTNEIGAQWKRMYNEKGEIIQQINPLGSTTQYHYESGNLVEIIDAINGSTQLKYDNHLNINQVITSDGQHSQWQYDKLGRCTETIDPKGNNQRKFFDLLGQVKQVQEPDGNERKLEYDKEGNVVHAQDKQHKVKFKYAGMSRMVAREEADARVEFLYNTEGDLIGIKNEYGFAYTFELNANGDVILEKGFDGLVRRYNRDKAGRVTQIQRAGNRFTKYEYNPLGNILTVQYSDSSGEQYAYRADGQLIEAKNEHNTVLFERDAIGKTLKETQRNAAILSQYDILGRRTDVASSLGTSLSFGHNTMGDVEKVQANNESGNWEASFKHDELGFEIERLLPGCIRTQWKRDRLGRPVEQRMVTAGGNTQRTRKYTWNVNDRLQQILDSKNGLTQFEHDVFGNLSAATYGDGHSEYRMPDAVGNLFHHKDRSDRKYGPAGQLLEAEGTRFQYDAEGNLIQKIEPSGKVWRYEWNDGGMLTQVIRPDAQEVNFTYDALGRRLTKAYRNKITHWLWDGNVPLHEWVEKRLFTHVYADDDRMAALLKQERQEALLHLEELTTWVFEPGKFSPLAKLKGEQRYSIVTDHLGTPLSMFNDSGEAVWEIELSIYGKVRNLNGWRESCPFRYQGQYEDVETGLYYNRFRYFDPIAGGYISQDPIGLNSKVYNLYRHVSDTSITYDPLGLDWNYFLKDSNGNPYYHGRASDNQSMNDVARRHSNTSGSDGARFGQGDTMTRVTPVGTDFDTVRGVEQRGIGENSLLGRNSTDVRGNKINGISDAKQNTALGKGRLAAADDMLDGKKVSEMPGLDTLKFKGCK